MTTSAVGFTVEKEALVKESWEVMKLHVPELSLKFFSTILEIAPAAKELFSFLKDSDEIPQNNPKLKSHAVKVFKMTCEAAVQLREKGEVVVSDTTLKYLGSVHLKKGVIDPHFEVVKEALLRTIRDAMGEKWSEDMNTAWGVAYDILASADTCTTTTTTATTDHGHHVAGGEVGGEGDEEALGGQDLGHSEERVDMALVTGEAHYQNMNLCSFLLTIHNHHQQYTMLQQSNTDIL